jgi:hypothetical protein
MDLELLETRQVPARNILRLKKVNLACGEGWVWQQLEQPRLDLSHGKGHRHEQSPFAHQA